MLRETSMEVALPPPPRSAPVDAEQLVAMFLDGRSPRTIDAYRRDLHQFAAFADAISVSDAARRLLALSPGAANALALRFRNDLVAREQAPASINRKLAALRALVALARTLGMVAWRLEVKNVRSRALRDTRGPGDAGVRALLAAAEAQPDRAKAARDVAVVRLLHDLALRRGEVCELDIADVDLVQRRLMVRGKGCTDSRDSAAGTALPSKSRATTGTKRLFRLSAKSTSCWHTDEAAVSGLSKNTTVSASVMSCWMRAYHASPFSMSSRSTLASMPRAFSSACKRSTKAMSLRE